MVDLSDCSARIIAGGDLHAMTLWHEVRRSIQKHYGLIIGIPVTSLIVLVAVFPSPFGAP